jgi:hypothetical protein
MAFDAPKVFEGQRYSGTAVGGTCLRMAYGSQRYSEDLDFNSNLGEDEAFRALETAAKELEYFGIRSEIRNKRRSRSATYADMPVRQPDKAGDVSNGSIGMKYGESGLLFSCTLMPIYTKITISNNEPDAPAPGSLPNSFSGNL